MEGRVVQMEGGRRDSKAGGARYCPSCGQNMDRYRERLMSLVHDNKALNLENRRLKAELLLLKRGASKAATSSSMAMRLSSSLPAPVGPEDSAVALMREIEMKLNQVATNTRSSTTTSTTFPHYQPHSTPHQPPTPLPTPCPTLLPTDHKPGSNSASFMFEDPYCPPSHPSTSQPAFAWTTPSATTTGNEYSSTAGLAPPSTSMSPCYVPLPSPKSSSRVSVSDLGPQEDHHNQNNSHDSQVERLTRQLNDLEATLLAGRTPLLGEQDAPALASSNNYRALHRSNKSPSPLRHAAKQEGDPSMSSTMALDLAHLNWISEDVLGWGLTRPGLKKVDGKRGSASPIGNNHHDHPPAVEEEDDPRVESMKNDLFLEVKRRLPTERAIEFLDHMRRLNDNSITYQEAWNGAFALLGPLNMDIFHAFLKVLYGRS